MLKIIFVGPSIQREDIKKLNLHSNIVEVFSIDEVSMIDILPHSSTIIIAPPITEGDILKVLPLNPSIIGIIDGYFENTTSIWHKEILFALKKGIAVIGAASMGALRAVELDNFGMIGLGKVYQDFKQGHIADDDEVTVGHAPASLSYINTSIAMVNIRETVEEAYKSSVLDANHRDRILSILKETFYKKRCYTLLKERIEDLNMDVVDNFITWTEVNGIDIKKNDSILLLKYADEFVDNQSVIGHNFHFEDTVIWRKTLLSI